jgi:peptide/nickel transport system substrate-binding protein
MKEKSSEAMINGGLRSTFSAPTTSAHVFAAKSAALAMYRSGQLDCGPASWWSVRQEDLESVQKTHPHLQFQDFLSTVSHAIYMRTDQAPFNDVRVRRAISHAVDRQAIIDSVWIKGEPTPAVSRGLAEWSPRIDELGAGAKYYQYDPKEARRLLAEAAPQKSRPNVDTLVLAAAGWSPMPRS